MAWFAKEDFVRSKKAYRKNMFLVDASDWPDRHVLRCRGLIECYIDKADREVAPVEIKPAPAKKKPKKENVKSDKE